MKDKSVIRKNYTYLIQNIDVTEILPYLYQEEIISRDSMERIEKSGVTKRDKAQRLLDYLERSDRPEIMHVFFSALEENDHSHVVEKLDPTCLTRRRSKLRRQTAVKSTHELKVNEALQGSSNENKEISGNTGHPAKEIVGNTHKQPQENDENRPCAEQNIETVPSGVYVQENGYFISHVNQLCDTCPKERFDSPDTQVRATHIARPILSYCKSEDSRVFGYCSYDEVDSTAYQPSENEVFSPWYGQDSLQSPQTCALPKFHNFSGTASNDTSKPFSNPVQNATKSITLRRKSLSEQWGFSFISGKSRARFVNDIDYYVYNVDKGSVADMGGICILDTLVSIQGQEIRNWSPSQVAELMKRNTRITMKLTSYQKYT